MSKDNNDNRTPTVKELIERNQKAQQAAAATERQDFASFQKDAGLAQRPNLANLQAAQRIEAALAAGRPEAPARITSPVAAPPVSPALEQPLAEASAPPLPPEYNSDDEALEAALQLSLAEELTSKIQEQHDKQAAMMSQIQEIDDEKFAIQLQAEFEQEEAQRAQGTVFNLGGDDLEGHQQPAHTTSSSRQPLSYAARSSDVAPDATVPYDLTQSPVPAEQLYRMGYPRTDAPKSVHIAQYSGVNTESSSQPSSSSSSSSYLPHSPSLQLDDADTTYSASRNNARRAEHNNLKRSIMRSNATHLQVATGSRAVKFAPQQDLKGLMQSYRPEDFPGGNIVAPQPVPGGVPSASPAHDPKSSASYGYYSREDGPTHTPVELIEQTPAAFKEYDELYNSLAIDLSPEELDETMRQSIYRNIHAFRMQQQAQQPQYEHRPVSSIRESDPAPSYSQNTGLLAKPSDQDIEAYQNFLADRGIAQDGFFDIERRAAAAFPHVHNYFTQQRQIARAEGSRKFAALTQQIAQSSVPSMYPTPMPHSITPSAPDLREFFGSIGSPTPTSGSPYIGNVVYAPLAGLASPSPSSSSQQASLQVPTQEQFKQYLETLGDLVDAGIDEEHTNYALGDLHPEVHQYCIERSKQKPLRTVASANLLPDPSEKVKKSGEKTPYVCAYNREQIALSKLPTARKLSFVEAEESRSSSRESSPKRSPSPEGRGR